MKIFPRTHKKLDQIVEDCAPRPKPPEPKPSPKPKAGNR